MRRQKYEYQPTCSNGLSGLNQMMKTGTSTAVPLQRSASPSGIYNKQMSTPLPPFVSNCASYASARCTHSTKAPANGVTYTFAFQPASSSSLPVYDLLNGAFYGADIRTPRYVATQIVVLQSAFYLLYAILCLVTAPLVLLARENEYQDPIISSNKALRASPPSTFEDGILRGQGGDIYTLAVYENTTNLSGQGAVALKPNSTTAERFSQFVERGYPTAQAEILPSIQLPIATNETFLEGLHLKSSDREQPKSVISEKTGVFQAFPAVAHVVGSRCDSRTNKNCENADFKQQQQLEQGQRTQNKAAGRQRPRSKASWRASAVFDSKLYCWSTLSGRMLLLIFFFSSVAMSYAVFLVVQRTRKCIDFCFSIQLLHVLLCWLVKGFPTGRYWWICCVSSAVLSTLLSQHLCRKVELQEIKVSWRSSALDNIP